MQVEEPLMMVILQEHFSKTRKLSSEITGIDLILINKFGTILTAMASGYGIKDQEFEKYAIETAK